MAESPKDALPVTAPRSFFKLSHLQVGGCQNYGALWRPLHTRYRITVRTQEGIMILTTTQMDTWKASGP